MTPGDALLAVDLVHPARTARRVVVEALLDSYGAKRGLDVDVWTMTLDQADELLAAVSHAAREEGTP